MKEQSNRSEFTIELDLGERRHRFCALNGKGEVAEEGTRGNDRASLARLTARYRGALAVMEAEAHSPWVSRYLEGLGWQVIVSNPRKVRAIYQHERKSDRRDALMLARIGRMLGSGFHADSGGGPCLDPTCSDARPRPAQLILCLVRPFRGNTLVQVVTP